MKDKKKNTVILSLIVAVIFIVSTILFARSYIQNLKADLFAETGQFLTEISSQAAVGLNHKINGSLQTLNAIANYVADEEPFSPQSVMPSLISELKTNTQFKRMGLILPDGTVHTTDGKTDDFSKREYFQIAMTGIPNVSSPFQDAFDGQTINVYAVPVYRDGKIAAVLFAAVHNSLFQELLAVPTFGGQGFSYVITRSGDLVVGSSHPNATNLPLSDPNMIFDSPNAAKQLEQDLESGKNGFISYTLDGNKYYVGYSPLALNDWVVLSVTPASVVTQRTDALIKDSIYTWAGIICLFAALLIFINLLQHKRKKECEYLAYVDILTGLSNWNCFLVDAFKLLADAPSGQRYALLSLDVDKFRLLKDSLGTERANAILQTIAAILQSHTGKNGLCARVTEDNFALLIAYRAQEDIVALVSAILSDSQQKIPDYDISLSFGIYEIDDSSLPIAIMYDRAVFAKQKIKGNYTVRYYFYNEEIRSAILYEKQLEDAMSTAVSQHEFLVYYQPQYSLHTGLPIGAEALARWKHPTLGFLMPDQFIPLFEKNGFIVSLDWFMLEAVCAALHCWSEENIPVFPVAVNLSRAHLFDPHIVEKLTQLVGRYHVSPTLLELEWTENILIYHTDAITHTLDQLRHAGFRIAMDDFGAGYSSLGLLKNLPVDTVKLDRSFFIDVADCQRSQIILSRIVSMLKELRLTTVAEGVEDEEQLALLKQLGCDIVQSFYYARPMPAEQYKHFLRPLNSPFPHF